MFLSDHTNTNHRARKHRTSGTWEPGGLGTGEHIVELGKIGPWEHMISETFHIVHIGPWKYKTVGTCNTIGDFWEHRTSWGIGGA